METSLQEKFKITVPKIPLADMLERLEEEATKPKEITVKKKGWHQAVLRFISREHWGTETRTIQAFDAKEFFNASKTDFLNELGKSRGRFADGVKSGIQRACEEYRQSNERTLAERREFLEGLKKPARQRDNPAPLR